MYRLISNLLPRKFVKSFVQLLAYADVKKNPDKILTFMVLYSFLSSLIITVLIRLFVDFNKIYLLPIFVALFVLINALFYFQYVLKADLKSQTVDEHFPDALQLMSSNLRAGLTMDRALLLSTRPEFGVLSNEINLVGKQITMGKGITEALLSMTKRIRSRSFEKTILLIVSGIKSGGELASLLQKTAEDLTQKKLVDKKVRTSVNLYVIFIFIAMGFGAPLLYGMSSYLVGILSKVLVDVEIPDSSEVDIPFNISSTPNIDEGFIVLFSLAFLITTVILGSFILGLIIKGKEKQGIKYIVPLLILAIGLFFLVRYVIDTLIGGSLVLT